MTLDTKLLSTFILLSQELSFSRTAARLNVTQPWVSERIRRLEERTGIRLFNRTSRTVELSADGKAFLPKAIEVLDAIEVAERTLHQLRYSSVSKLRLGVQDYYLSYPDREILVEWFMRSNPQIMLNIHWGSTEDLLPKLVNGEIDFLFSSMNVNPHGGMLEPAPICTRRAMIMVPDSHPLSSCKAINIENLAGACIAVSPGRSNPDSLKTTLRPLIEVGAQLVDAPEGHRVTVERFAQIHGLMCLRWVTAVPVDCVVEGMSLVPINKNPLKTTTALWRRRGSQSSVGQQLWRSAGFLHRVIKARDAEPAYDSIKSDLERPLSEH